MSRTQDLQNRAMAIVEIRPMSDEANALISQAIEEHGFPNRAEAYRFLGITGKLKGIDVGGEIARCTANKGVLADREWSEEFFGR